MQSRSTYAYREVRGKQPNLILLLGCHFTSCVTIYGGGNCPPCPPARYGPDDLDQKSDFSEHSPSCHVRANVVVLFTYFIYSFLYQETSASQKIQNIFPDGDPSRIERLLKSSKDTSLVFADVDRDRAFSGTLLIIPLLCVVDSFIW